MYRMPEEYRKDIPSLFLKQQLPNYMLGQLLQSEESGWKAYENLKQRNSIKEMLNNMHENDLEAANERDYDLILYDLQNRLQELYDKIFINDGSLKGKKPLLDVAYIKVQMAIEEAESYMRELENMKD